ncbi:MAG TPA: S24 family peptidase [Hyphomicrobiaceae bacterium]|nr:S24 family peptidase [Hyphomicrobiaceae bacterium]
MNHRPLHPVQSELLELLASHLDEPLSIRELQAHVGASSTSVVAHHLQQLERKGYLKRNPYNPRDYQVVQGNPEAAIAYISLYGLATCGPHGSILDGDPIDKIPLASRLLSFPVAEAFMVKAKGKSMEPRISEGDLVVARKTRTYKDGKVYVCVNNEECLIKIVRVSCGQVFLESFNRERFPILPASTDFRVEGEVRNIISGRV